MKRLGLALLILFALSLISALGIAAAMIAQELLGDYSILLWLSVVFIVIYKSLK